MSNKEWGNITWNLLHTIAAQINENKFNKIRTIVITIIVDTCHNLPCPTCRQEATNLIKMAYLQNIQTKKHLVEFLRQLHNIVNNKLNKKIFSSGEIENIYITLNLNQLIHEFIQIYTKSYHNMKLTRNDFHKKIFITKFKNDIKNLINTHKQPS